MRCRATPAASALRVLVPVLPRIANHTDFDPLRLHPQIDFHYAQDARELGGCRRRDSPGSKSVSPILPGCVTRWPKYLEHHLRYGAR